MEFLRFSKPSSLVVVGCVIVVVIVIISRVTNYSLILKIRSSQY